VTRQSTLRVGLAGLNQLPLDWKGNMQRIRAVRQQAQEMGVRLLCLPELVVSGYGCEDRFLHPDTAERSLALVRELAAECGREVLLIGFPFLFEGKLYNAVAVLNEGRIRGIFPKTHLAREGIHYEPRWFTPWPGGEHKLTLLGGDPIPLGTFVYSIAGFTFSLEICEDAWVTPDKRPCRLVNDSHWIFNTSASHYSLGKADIRERLVCESSALFGIGYAYANLVGCESGRAIYDGELLIAEEGKIVNRSDRLYLQDHQLLCHDVHYEPRPHVASIHLDADVNVDGLPEALPNRGRKEAEREQEFAMAATLALFDYMRKSHSNGFTLSLSGGVDSATVAVLVHLMAGRLVRELTPAQRREKLAWIAGVETDDVKRLTGLLLTTVYQATRNSGPVTREAAAMLAAAIGAQPIEWDVDALVEGYKQCVSAAVGRELTWQRDDITLQNIQARVRAPGVWMLANMEGRLLLTTSNRSEVAVGYATMDGDTCGGLAPIAGVEKSFLRRWLRHMEKKGLTGMPPLAALAYINNQKPTAELRPPEEGQTDEDDLMPYEVLDALEESLIARRRKPVEAFTDVTKTFGSRHGTARLYQWTKQFCQMFARSQWKRERYAPAFHLDDRNLDPKTWARYPILSGAFEVELEELDANYRSLTNPEK